MSLPKRKQAKKKRKTHKHGSNRKRRRQEPYVNFTINESNAILKDIMHGQWIILLP